MSKNAMQETIIRITKLEAAYEYVELAIRAIGTARAGSDPYPSDVADEWQEEIEYCLVHQPGWTLQYDSERVNVERESEKFRQEFEAQGYKVEFIESTETEGCES